MLRSLRFGAPILFLLALTAARPAAAETPVYAVAVLPTAPPVTMYKLWTPLIERVSKETGLDLRLKLYERMAEFERDIWGGGPDLLFGSPIQAVVAHQSAGYVPLVRSGKLVAIGLFVRAESPIHTLDDLTGKRISFVGNKNLCSVFMRHLFAKQKKDLVFEKEYAGSTRNVILNVLLGKVDAGTVFRPDLDNESEETLGQIREVVRTPEIAPHPLSAHPRVASAAQQAIKKSILAFAATPEGARLLKSLRLEAPVVADYDKDYRFLEEIDIKGMTNWGQ